MLDASWARGRSRPPAARSRPGEPGGFWEFDLFTGTARYDDWFFRKLGWARGDRRTTLADLRPVVAADTWNCWLRDLRHHLEHSAPLDTRISVRLADGRTECWRVNGSARRDLLGYPFVLAGTMREAAPSPTPA